MPLFTENMQTRRFETALFFEGEEATACITYGKPKDESIQDYAEIVALYILPWY